MTPECRNDCVEPLLFPQRPNNRPGLSHINYRIGTYADFRDALLRHLNQDAILAPWTHRNADDPGIALLEGAAILGDILTFYQELYANEAYLRTAQWRESIADLVRLLGYRLSPGLGGRGIFAFEIGGDKPVVIPTGFPITAQVTGLEELADFETAEATVTYPWLSQFHLFRPLHTPYITGATQEFYIFAPDPFLMPVSIEPGDRLLIGDPSPSANPTSLLNGEIVIVDAVQELHGRTLYKIKGALTRTGSTFEIAAFKIGRSFRHFGHNAPPTTTVVSGNTVSQPAITYLRSLHTDTTTDVKPGLTAQQFPLDGVVEDLPLGAPLLCQAALAYNAGSLFYWSEVLTLIRKAVEVRQASYTWGAVTAPATLVTLDAVLTTATAIATEARGMALPRHRVQFSTTATFDALDIRDIQFHETLSPLLRLRARPVETATVSGHDVYFLGTDAEARSLKERRLLGVKAGDTPQLLKIPSVQTLAPEFAHRRLLRRVTVDTLLTYANFPNENPEITVYGNLVDATQGKTEREVALGNGDSRQVFQTFKLPKAPLTYHNAAGATPPEVPELRIYVNNRLWQRVPSLFHRGEKEEIYIVREDTDGESWVQFGDGKTGARLPSGIKNVVARYRTGNGAYGALREGTNAQAGGRLDRLQKIRLPGVISGGAQPEAGDKARVAAPGKVQSLDRLVSLRDFETETLAIPGVVRASAAWDLVDNVPAVVITVLMETGRDAEIMQVRQILAAYNRCRGPQRFPIVVYEGHVQYLYLDASLACDPALREALVLQAVKQALGVHGEAGHGTDGEGGLLAVNRRQFGEKEYASRIAGTIQNVAGVLWARVNGLGTLGTATDPLTLVASLPAAPWPLASVVHCDADKILSLHTAHLQLSAVKAPGGSC
jgi:hypothetical protein